MSDPAPTSTLATADDVKNAWLGPGKLNTGDDKITTWLGKAEREIRNRVDDLDARLAAEAAETPPSTRLRDLVIDVAVDMVIRKLQNPDGTRSRTKGTGPFNRAVTYGGDNPGALEPTDAELDKLKPKKVKAGEIDLVHPDPATPDWWW